MHPGQFCRQHRAGRSGGVVQRAGQARNGVAEPHTAQQCNVLPLRGFDPNPGQGRGVPTPLLPAGHWWCRPTVLLMLLCSKPLTSTRTTAARALLGLGFFPELCNLNQTLFLLLSRLIGKIPPVIMMNRTLLCGHATWHN